MDGRGATCDACVIAGGQRLLCADSRAAFWLAVMSQSDRDKTSNRSIYISSIRNENFIPTPRQAVVP